MNETFGVLRATRAIRTNKQYQEAMHERVAVKTIIQNPGTDDSSSFHHGSPFHP